MNFIKNYLTAATSLAMIGTLGFNIAYAGGQYEVIDAELIDQNACEMEAWTTNSRQAGEGFFAGASCRLAQPIQATLIAGRERDEGDWTKEYGLEGLWLFRELDTHGFGMGLAAGMDYNNDDKRWNNQFLILPLTLQSGANETMLHGNLGLERDRYADRKQAVVWGLGAELPLNDAWSLYIETVGDDRSENDPLLQLGPRIELAQGLVTLDLTYSRTLASERNDAISVGFTFTGLSF